MSNRDCNPQPDCGSWIGGDLEWGRAQGLVSHNLPGEQRKCDKVKPGQPNMAFICRGERSEGRESKFGLQWRNEGVNTVICLAKKRKLTGGTRLLNGWGGRIGITMRKITIADAIKDKKASTRATTREIMFFKLVVIC